jgi:hypothetical protein
MACHSGVAGTAITAHISWHTAEKRQRNHDREDVPHALSGNRQPAVLTNIPNNIFHIESSNATTNK